MPAFVFATRAMHAAALPLLDELAEPVAVLRNPDPADPRSVHVLSGDQFARLVPLLQAAGIEIQMLDGAAPSQHGRAAPALVASQTA